MKKVLSLIVLTFLPIWANADAVEIAGIYYNLNTEALTAEVVSNPNMYTGVVTIPEKVTYMGKSYNIISIGKHAFSGCTELLSVDIPDGVTTICDEAFYSCNSLTSIKLPKELVKLECMAFSNCNSLKSVRINSKLTMIDDCAESPFFACTNIESIVVDDNNTTYDSRDNCNAIIETSTNRLIYGCNNTTIPQGVTAIGKYAFQWSEKLSTINIPNSVSSIEFGAFRNCVKLTSLFIPKSVTYIGNNAFPSEGDISSITVEVGNSVYDSRSNCNALIETNTNTLILGCKNTVIPNSVTAIGPSAFYGNEHLTKVYIPPSVNSIGSAAFNKCSNITDVYCYVEGVPAVNGNIFYLSSVATATLHVLSNFVNKYQNTFPWKNFGSFVGVSNNELKAEDYVNGIKYSFNKATLEAEVISSNPQYKGDIIIPATVNYEGLTFTVTTIGNAFYKCREIKSITLPETINTIRSGAFTTGCNIKIIIPSLSFWLKLKIEGQLFGYYEGREDGAYITYYSSCNLITDGREIGNVIIPDGIENIGDYTFSRCGISSVKISNTVKTIGNSAFEGTRLYSIDIPNGVTTIGDYAFCDTQLSSINIPNSVLTIGGGAFLNCRNLSIANLGSGVRNIGENAFSGSSVSSIELPEGMTIISKDAFANCSKLTSVKIPESVTTIGYGAFRHSGLTELNLPSSLREIQEEAFYGIPIEELVIPNSVTSIRRTAFHSCKKLTKIKLSESLSKISEYTFNHCESLTYVDIPNSVTSIGIWAFSYSGLRSARLGKNINNISSAFLYCKDLEYIIITSDKIPSIQYTDRGIDNLSCQFIIPHSTYENGIPEEMTNFATYTSIPMYIKAKFVGATSAVLELQPIDNVYGYSDNQTSVIITKQGLKPEEYIGWEFGDNSGLVSIKTETLNLVVQEPKILSTTKARLIATVEEADDFEHYGFEWRQYDAPEGRPSNKVSAPLYNGRIVGTLNNLNPDKDYKYRPFYKSDSGEMYYGEWMWLYTGDADVYFEPEVYTKDAADITKVSALLAGVWFEGTDIIEEKGFEYWTVSNNKTRTAGSDAKKVIVSSNSNLMTTTLEGLTAGATYGYRSYARTASGTTYGEEKTFRTILVGDVNSDGVLDEKDLKDLADYIMGKTPKGFNKKEADLNNDNKVNAADIVKLVDLLGK